MEPKYLVYVEYSSGKTEVFDFINKSKAMEFVKWAENFNDVINTVVAVEA